jgi:hypothetical protein
MPFSPVPVSLKARARLEGSTLVFQDATVVVQFVAFDEEHELPILEVAQVTRSNGIDLISPQWWQVQRVADLNDRPTLAITFKGSTFSQVIISALSTSGELKDRALYDALVQGEKIYLDIGQGAGDPVIIELGYVSG